MLHLDCAQTRVLSQIFELLAERQHEHDIRVRLGELVSRLLRAESYASYVWSEASHSFTGRVAIHMSDSNLSRYEAYYQFHDPITHLLRERSEPTLVTSILPQRELMRTEFFNDFLQRDGLYWGVNLHVRVAGECTGDLRIWRDRRGDNFGDDELALLRMIMPAFRAALRRCHREGEIGASGAAAANGQEASEHTRQIQLPLERPPLAPAGEGGLTAREAEIARLAAGGMSDKEIAGALAISFTTVRTHLKHTFRKLNVDNRVKLAGRV
jgi:DNA-binding CsgD family transcriptional regulator